MADNESLFALLAESLSARDTQRSAGPKQGGEVVSAQADKEVEFTLQESELDSIRERLSKIDALLSTDTLKRTPSKRPSSKPSKRSTQLLQDKSRGSTISFEQVKLPSKASLTSVLASGSRDANATASPSLSPRAVLRSEESDEPRTPEYDNASPDLTLHEHSAPAPAAAPVATAASHATENGVAHTNGTHHVSFSDATPAPASASAPAAAAAAGPIPRSPVLTHRPVSGLDGESVLLKTNSVSQAPRPIRKSPFRTHSRQLSASFIPQEGPLRPDLDARLTLFPWFVGPMSREAAEAVLNEAAAGTLLVRRSGDHLIVSVRNPQHGVNHLKIAEADGSFSIADNEPFASIPEMVRHYVSGGSEFSVRLWNTTHMLTTYFPGSTT